MPERAAARSRVQLAPEQGARWFRPGEAVRIDRFVIANGMIYAGTFLPADPRENATAHQTPAPCLVNPHEKTQAPPDRNGNLMGYWPSYTSILPPCRLAYLEWLADGARAQDVAIGYVFLYFYGIERRLLVDAPDDEEISHLVAEISRLRKIFQSNKSFETYSRTLIEVAAAKALLRNQKRALNWAPNPLAGRELGQPMSPAVKVAIALHTVNRRPLPADLAIMGYLTLPEISSNPGVMVQFRDIRPELVRLVRARYADAFPEGGFMLRDMSRRPRLQIRYKPASQYLPQDLLDGAATANLPDPTQLDWSEMAAVIMRATQDLSGYGRYVARAPERKASTEALLLLPAEIQGDEAKARLAEQAEWLATLQRPMARLPLAEVTLNVLGPDAPAAATPGAKTVRAAADLLMWLGYGMEPDPVFGAVRPDVGDQAVVFPAESLEGLRAPPRMAYEAATAAAKLLAGAAAATGDPEAEPDAWGVAEIARLNGLSPPERRRLQAHALLAAARPLQSTRLKKVAAEVPGLQRNAVAQLISASVVDARKVPAEQIAYLEVLHDALGVARGNLYEMLHSTGAVDEEPVTVERQLAGGHGGFRIPAPPVELARPVAQSSPMEAPAALAPSAPVAAVVQAPPLIDLARVRQIQAETQEVSAVLASVFAEETPAAAEVDLAGEGRADHAGADAPSCDVPAGLSGLDADHAQLVVMLLRQTEWSRGEFDAAARGLGLMPDGAIEALNEWSFDRHDDALIEDGDPLVLNPDVVAAIAA